MSTAAARAMRAGIREGSGSGAVGLDTAGGNENPEIPSLTPSDDSVIKILQGRTLLKLEEKYDIFASFHHAHAPLSVILLSLSTAATDEFDAIDWGGKLKKKYSADFLGETLFRIYKATKLVHPPNTANYQLLTPDQQDAITTLYKRVNSAIHDASSALNNSFSNAFFTVNSLPPGEYDRRYLEDGYLPTVPGFQYCIVCGLRACDEPNTNIVAAQRNAAKKITYHAQLLEDEQKRERGEVVLNNKNMPMADGRKRNAPKYESLLIHCHGLQCGCTSDVGDVPASECPIKCIDPETGDRYPVDISGVCECPYCKSKCNAVYSVS